MAGMACEEADGEPDTDQQVGQKGSPPALGPGSGAQESNLQRAAAGDEYDVGGTTCWGRRRQEHRHYAGVAGKRTRLGMLGKVAGFEQPRCRTCFLEQPGLVPHRLAPATDRFVGKGVLVAPGIAAGEGEAKGHNVNVNGGRLWRQERRQAQTAN